VGGEVGHGVRGQRSEVGSNFEQKRKSAGFGVAFLRFGVGRSLFAFWISDQPVWAMRVAGWMWAVSFFLSFHRGVMGGFMGTAHTAGWDC
jgi:hypothetical protein